MKMIRDGYENEGNLFLSVLKNHAFPFRKTGAVISIFVLLQRRFRLSSEIRIFAILKICRRIWINLKFQAIRPPNVSFFFKCFQFYLTNRTIIFSSKFCA